MFLKVKADEVVPENEIIIKEYIKDYKSANKSDLLAEELEKDVNKILKIFRMVAHKKTVEVSNDRC